ALERWSDIPGIAVGRDDDLAYGYLAPFGRYQGSMGLARDPCHARSGTQRDAVAPACIEEALAVECRMQLARALHHHAAKVEVACDLLVLARLRQHVGLAVGVAVEHIEFASKIVIMPRRVGADEAPLTLVKAFDPLAGNDLL